MADDRSLDARHLETTRERVWELVTGLVMEGHAAPSIANTLDEVSAFLHEHGHKRP